LSYLYPPNCSPGAGKVLTALRLALRDYLSLTNGDPTNPEKYLLKALYAFSQYVKELFLGSRFALPLLLATSINGFASGKQDFDKKKSWVPEGGNGFF
jgi:hypothetical protein